MIPNVGGHFRRFSVFIVGLAVSLASEPTLVTAQQRSAQQRSAQQRSAQQRDEKQNQLQNENQGQSKNATTEGHNPEETHINGPITIQGPVHVISEPSAEEKEQQAEDSLKPFWKKPEWVGIAVGMLASIFAFLAFRATRRQAQAAEAQVGIMRQQFEMTNRAYLDTDNWTIDLQMGSLLETVAGKVSCEIRHFGKTPATIISISITRSVQYVERPNAMLYPDGRPYIFRFLAPVSSEQLIGDRLTFDITGTVRYTDGFEMRDKDFARIFLRTTERDVFYVPEGPHNNERVVHDPD